MKPVLEFSTICLVGVLLSLGVTSRATAAARPCSPAGHRDGSTQTPVEVGSLFHRLNNQLGVILASGYDHQELQGRFDGVGFAAFVQKPFEIGKLVETVREIAQAAKRGSARA